jgi:hypothetical protein
MGPGVPGMGIASVFYVAAALVAPVREIVRTLQGNSSPMRWKVVGRQFSLALLIVGSIVMLYLSIQVLISRGLLSVPAATDLPGGFPNWAYAVGILVILLIGVTLTAWAVGLWVRRTGMEDDSEVIAHAYRASIPASGNNDSERVPRGRHVAPLQNVAALPARASSHDLVIDLRPPAASSRPRGRHLIDEELEDTG